MTFEPTRRTVALPTGIRMAYVQAGRAGGPAVILLHGYTDTSRSWIPTLEAMVEAGTDLQVIAVDQRGHGGSSMPDAKGDAASPENAFSMAAMAADVVALMDQLGIRQAHVVGHSLGSQVAQELALSHPDRLNSIVLVGTWACSVGNPGVDQFLVPLIEGWREALVRRPGFDWPRDAYHLTPRDADPGVEAWIAQNWALEIAASPEFVAQVVPETATTRLGTWIGVLRNMARIDNRERLKHLTVPALVLWATQDNFFVESDQAQVRAALDSAVQAGKTRYVFKTYGRAALPASGAQESDLGHNTQWGAPGAVAADIQAWVKTGRPTSDLPWWDAAQSRLHVDAGAAQVLVREPSSA